MMTSLLEWRALPRNQPQHLLLRLSLFIALVLVGCQPPREVSRHAHLIPTTPLIGPLTRFEIRLEQAMVDPEQVGKPVPHSPLKLDPPVPGTFVWVSQRSGMFEPSEPLVPGTTYRFTFSQRLQPANGRLVHARLHRTLTVPGLKVGMDQFDWRSLQYAGPLPNLRLIFNQNVAFSSAKGFIHFQDEQGNRVPARVEWPSGQSVRQRYGNKPEHWLTWSERFEQGRDSSDTNRLDNLRNLLQVSPTRPLIEGVNWSLVVEKGLPSRSARLAKDERFALGRLLPFEVKEVRPANSRQHGRRIAIRFSHPLASRGRIDSMPELEQWIKVSPVPADYRLRAANYWVELEGDWQLNRDYAVTIADGLEAHNGQVLALNQTRHVQFEPMPARLHFPGLDVRQQAAGNREMILRTINANRVEISARQLDRNTLIHGLRGFKSYRKSNGWTGHSWEPYQEVNYQGVPGREIYRKSIRVNGVPDQPKDLVLRWDEILGLDRPGAVFLMAEQVVRKDGKRQRQGTQTLVQLTDLGLAWKRSETGILVQVVSQETGLPVSGADVSLMDNNNQVLADGVTDHDGLLLLDGNARGQWLMASHGDDLHAVEVDHNGISLYDYGLRYRYRGNNDGCQLLLFSDRPAYRAGETVHFKGLVRHLRSDRLEMPDQTHALLRIYDPRHEEFFRTNCPISELGSFTASLTVPEGRRGTYQARVNVGPNIQYLPFQVQDFEPNEFSVQLDHQAHYEAGDALEFPVRARYFMGSPVNEGTVRWSLAAQDTGFHPKGFEAYTFTTGVGDPKLGLGFGNYAFQGDGRLSPRESFRLQAELPLNKNAPRPRHATLRASVTDLNLQTITTTAEFTQHSSAFYLGIRLPHQVVRVDEPVPMDMIAVNHDGTPVIEPIPVDVRIYQQAEDVQRTARAGGGIDYSIHKNRVETGHQVVRTRSIEAFGTGWMVQPGATNDVVTFTKSGIHLLEASATDDQGNDVRTLVRLHVYDPDSGGRNRIIPRHQTRIELVPDKTSYEAGETAKVLLKTPVTGKALVTVERSTVRRQFVADLQGTPPAISVPVEPGDAPNIFVSVMQLQGARDNPRASREPQYRLGYCELNVTDPDLELDVRVQPDTPSYQPGEYVSVNVDVRDASGSAVNGAEVTLYAVDEGILSLTGYTMPDPFAFFNQPRHLVVRTGTTLNRLLSEDFEKLPFYNKGFVVGGGGRQAVRQEFLPCAFWDAGLITGPDGRVQVKFRAPDSLTEYRLVAVVNTRHHRFATARAAFEVNKPIMIEPALPRFAHLNDRLIARAVVYNRTAIPSRVTVNLELDTKAVLADPDRDPSSPGTLVTVPAGGSQIVEFPLNLVEVGEARWVWSARFLNEPGFAGRTEPDLQPVLLKIRDGALQDAVVSLLDIKHVLPLRREILSARPGTIRTNLLAMADPQLLEGEGTVKVIVSNSRMCELSEAVSQLLHYPYGCVEQTSSSLLPWITLHRSPALKHFVTVPTSAKHKRSPVDAGVERLLAMQTADGGLSYWPGRGESQLWGSAYGGMVLGLARQTELAVPEAPYQRLLQYLRQQLRGSREARGDLSARCLALYALALGDEAQPAYWEVLFDRRDQLSAENRALLALAILESYGPEPLVSQLLQSDTRAASDDPFGNHARAVAIRLLAWSRFRLEDAGVDRMFNALINEKRKGHWTSTQGNAWSLHALTDFDARTAGDLSRFQGNLTFGDATWDYELDENQPVLETSFSIQDAPSHAPLMLNNPQQRRLFTQVILESRAEHQPIQHSGRGYRIERRYQELGDDGIPVPADDLEVGDVVLVTLNVRVDRPSRYMVIDDALPAVFEAINPGFTSHAALTDASRLLKTNWRGDHRELREDRALFFRNYVPPNKYVIQYLARVRAAGTVAAPPAMVGEMYEPEHFGLTAPERITVISSR